MKLYTKTGDDGSTGLHGGGHIEKGSPRVEAMSMKNADYVSMTQPHAAGSLLSSVPEEKSSGVDREGNPLSSGAMRMMNGGSSRSVTGTQVAVINDGVWIPFRRASSKKITDGTS